MAKKDRYGYTLIYMGLGVTLIGFMLLYRVFSAARELTYGALTAFFTVLFLALLLILAHSNQTVRDELARLLREHEQETEILRRINEEKLAELKYRKKRQD